MTLTMCTLLIYYSCIARNDVRTMAGAVQARYTVCALPVLKEGESKNVNLFIYLNENNSKSNELFLFRP